jgi:hypothetical protein
MTLDYEAGTKTRSSTMYLFNARPVLQAAALTLAVVLAPAANAAETATRNGVTLSRDTGVGLQIAAQGNEALRQIRAELKAAARALMQPKLPGAARVVKMSQPAGAAIVAGPSVRCAK